MGTGLLAVADVVRKYPDVVEFLKTAKPEGAEAFFERLGTLDGGSETAGVIREFLGKFGTRCPGELDITRPRWIEEPAGLAAMILSNIENFAP